MCTEKVHRQTVTGAAAAGTLWVRPPGESKSGLKPHQASNGKGPKTAELRPGLRCRAGGRKGPKPQWTTQKQNGGGEGEEGRREGEEGEAGREVRALGIRPKTNQKPV